jgi:hypothetical protein
MNKKQAMLAAIILIAATTFSHAQSFYPVLGKFSQAKKEALDRNYRADLESRNEGIVESSLAIVTMIKLDLPAEKLPLIKEQIEILKTSGTTPVIRYKAYLAGTVFADPSMFRQVSLNRYDDQDQFFNAVAGKLNQMFLSSK